MISDEDVTRIAQAVSWRMVLNFAAVAVGAVIGTFATRFLFP